MNSTTSGCKWWEISVAVSRVDWDLTRIAVIADSLSKLKNTRRGFLLLIFTLRNGGNSKFALPLKQVTDKYGRLNWSDRSGPFGRLQWGRESHADWEFHYSII
jgi:hypothetical protein